MKPIVTVKLDLMLFESLSESSQSGNQGAVGRLPPYF